MDLLEQFRRQQQFLKDNKQRRELAESEAKERSAVTHKEVLEELYPEYETYDAMVKETQETEKAFRAAVMEGQYRDVEGVTTMTSKQVEVDTAAALRWAVILLLDLISPYDFEVTSNDEIVDDLELTDVYGWLTLSKEGVKAIEDAVKNRTFEVPADVAQYSEKVSSKLYLDKILNPKVKEE